MALDSEVANLANAARSVAKAQEISVADAFGNLTASLAPKEPRQRRKPLSAFDAVTYLYDPTDNPAALSADEKRQERARTLRLGLEAALLRLDACCSPTNVFAEPWPSDAELSALTALINETVRSIGKRMPATCRERCRKIDRRFPKLSLWRRIEGFVTRIANVTPPRPLSVLLGVAGSNSELLKMFLAALGKTRRGEDLAAVKWLDLKPLLLLYQNAELARAGETPWSVLRGRRGAPNGPPEIEAYVAVLELDRADLLWKADYFRKLWPVQRWVQTLGNAKLLRKLELYYAGTFSSLPVWINGFEKLKVTLQREGAKARKAKSRKKLREKAGPPEGCGLCG